MSGILEKSDTSSSGPLSVHRRAEAILKNNPLIGQSFTIAFYNDLLMNGRRP